MGHTRAQDIVGSFLVSTIRTGYLPHLKLRQNYETVVFDKEGRLCDDRVYRRSHQAELGHARFVEAVRAHPENYPPIRENTDFLTAMMKRTYEAIRARQSPQTA